MALSSTLPAFIPEVENAKESSSSRNVQSSRLLLLFAVSATAATVLRGRASSVRTAGGTTRTRTRRPKRRTTTRRRFNNNNSISSSNCLFFAQHHRHPPSLLVSVALVVFAVVASCSNPHFGRGCCSAFVVVAPAPRSLAANTNRNSKNQQQQQQQQTTTCIMGIRGFRSWFESQFPDSMVAFSKDEDNREHANSNAAAASPASSATTSAESFDHVLIDMNQLLHIVLRKSRSDGHGLTLLMKELDAIVHRVATPQQSLVLAMDGPPSAAKLATQRKRRFQTVTKTAVKLQKLEQLLQQNKNTASRKKQKQIRQWTRKKRKAAAETRTLCISPATEFMAQAEQAILYWAWQRLSARHGPLRQVKIFISGSTVPGEGEVKLLEWMYHHRQRRGASVALLGGDSDLVLEALVVPLQITHNVFVLLPDGSRRYLAVNLWETTRQLDRMLMPSTTAVATSKTGTEQQQQQQQQPTSTSIRHMIRIRTDLVVLLMLNGNDYLPKLRGSSGFNRLFHTYLKLQREWRHKNENAENAYLVDPDTLEFQLDFGIQFFGRLASMAPRNLWSHRAKQNGDDNTPLQQLHNLVDMSFLPQPMEFRVIRDSMDNESDDDEQQQQRVVNEEEEEAEDVDADEEEDSEDFIDDEGEEEDVTNEKGTEEEEPDENKILIRLCLGEPGSEDFYSYDVWHPRGVPLKKARQKLAAMALADLMENDDNADDDSDDDDDDVDLGITSSGYEWEIRHTVEGKVDSYLYGLLWNLQTYQDGVCVDYSYNYGKRLSPMAKEIVKFFTDAKRENRKVGPRELNPKCFTPSVSAGVSCLAALPSPVKHLVPEPYRNIPDETVEAFYAKCMDPEDNVFDMKRFEQLCENEVSSVLQKQDASRMQAAEPPRNGRRILMGDHYWTVIVKVPKPLPHPFDPPEPFSDRFSKLRPNNRIRVSRLMALAEPRPRSAWNDDTKDLESLEIRHSDPGPFLTKLKTVDQVDYRLAYKKKKKRRGLRKGKLKISVHVKEPSTVNGAEHNKDSSKISAVNTADRNGNNNNAATVDVKSRMKAFNIVPPPTAPATNKNGETAMAILKQLSDLKMTGPVKWETSAPSQSEYASFDPHNHELVRLIVSRGSNSKMAVLHEDLVYEQDRETNNESRKMLQHHLASFALCDITGPAIRWSEVSYQEVKDFLTNTKVEG